jgi:hypothetical protein
MVFIKGQISYMKGVKWTPEMMKNRKGMLGKKHTPETKLKLRLAHLGKIYSSRGKKKPSMSGPNHPNWKGGTTTVSLLIRNHRLSKEWRSSIFKRDNYTCRQCNSKNGNGKSIKLNAHHIKPFIKIIKENNIKTWDDASKCSELWDINNGITLCKECHDLTKEGRKNFDYSKFCI